ncbi:MAG: prolipoprotein diacylglyceryl transferase [Pseudomonadota bacterium]
MFAVAIPFPEISPNVFSIELGNFGFALRWYALAYIVGILVGWWMGIRIGSSDRLWTTRPSPLTREQADEFITWIILGIILGGRLGFVLFYQPAYYLANPLEIFMIWQGGMAFHGGFLGVAVAIVIYSRRQNVSPFSVADVVAIATPPGIFLGRIANFINAELWGRPTDLPWGVIFPGEAAQNCGPDVLLLCARHPSQLYEAALEGLILGGLLLYLAYRRAWLELPGQITGMFIAGYGVARFLVEFARQADQQFVTPGNPFGHVIGIGPIGITMGQTLSLPMIVVGLALIAWARRKG